MINRIFEKLYGLLPDILKYKLLGYICLSLPTHFGIEVTNICNASCSFCGYRFQNRKKGFIDISTFRKAIDDYCDIGGGALVLTPTVGEPLSDKDLLDKIKYARSKKEIGNIMFYSNLISLSQFNIDEFLTSGLSCIKISTCIKDRETFKDIYKVDCYDQVLRNIISLCERNEQLCNPVEIKLYLRAPKPFAEVKKSSDYITISKYFKDKDVSFLDDSYDSWGGKIKEEDLPYGNKLYNISYDITKEPCYELFRRINILCDGNVNVCVCRDLDADLKIGNINNNNILDIWRGKELINLREDWANGNIPNICIECERYLPLSVYFERQYKNIIKRFLNNKFHAYHS